MGVHHIRTGAVYVRPPRSQTASDERYTPMWCGSSRGPAAAARAAAWVATSNTRHAKTRDLAAGAVGAGKTLFYLFYYMLLYWCSHTPAGGDG